VLWDHLLTKPVKEKLRSSLIQDLILSLDEELIHIPWELLFDGGNFLCLNFNVGRLVRTKEQPGSVQYRSFPSTPKMLVLANPTNDLKGAYLEGLNIKNQFDRRRNSVLIDFKSTQIDKLYVKKALGDYEIVHFAGHCEYDADNPKNTGWVLNDGRFTARDILMMGESVSMPTLVFSNACYSARTSAPDADYHEKNYNLASSFLLSGVRHYIGAIRRVEDPISQDFAKEFYAQLIAGKSVGECVRLGRLKLIKECGISAIPWVSYILYGDPNFVLFKAKIHQHKASSKRKLALSKDKLIWAALAGAIVLISIFLNMWVPSLNPRTYALFQKAQNLFASGNNDAVIALSRSLINSDPLFLNTYPQLAQTYLRRGEWEKAIKAYFDYALASEKKRDKNSLAQAYTGIAWVYHLEGEYQKAKDYYDLAINISKGNKDKLNEAIALRKLAVWHIDKDEYDRALELLTKSSEINRERQNIAAHRYNLACDYFDIGLVFTDKDDFAAAREFYGKSRLLFEKLHLKDELSDYYFNLGEIYQYEMEFQKALGCYKEGLKIDMAQNNKINLPSDYNMLGELYAQMYKNPEAKDCFVRAIDLAKQINVREELALAYRNLGVLYKKEGSPGKALECLRSAQDIYRQVDISAYEEIKNELLTLNN
jgi:tetratricopeptide (TPR) repeat protein